MDKLLFVVACIYFGIKEMLSQALRNVLKWVILMLALGAGVYSLAYFANKIYEEQPALQPTALIEQTGKRLNCKFIRRDVMPGAAYFVCADGEVKLYMIDKE